MSAVTPIRSIKKTFPEAGRIRLGVKAKTKGGKEYPKAIDTFRLTSQYRAPLEQAAELWGGHVGPWNDQWEVVTETNTMDIVLPLSDDFDPLGGTPVYELWSAGGCTRRCDGETVVMPTSTGPDTVEMTESPCICSAKGVLECSPKLRMTIGLPDLDFYGFWRLETGSMYAIQENQGMLELITQLQAHGIQRGVLTLERREIKKPGAKTKKFVVPIIRLAGSMNELQAGTHSMQSLGTVHHDRPALSSPPPGEDGGLDPVPAPHSSSSTEDGEASVEEPTADAEGGGGETDSGRGAAVASSLGEEDIIDAEIVEDEEPPPPPRDNAARAKRRATFMAVVQGDICKLKYDREVRPWLEANYGGSWSELDDATQERLVNKLTSGTRAEKEEAQRKLGELVREWNSAEVSA